MHKFLFFSTRSTTSVFVCWEKFEQRGRGRADWHWFFTTCAELCRDRPAARLTRFLSRTNPTETYRLAGVRNASLHGERVSPPLSRLGSQQSARECIRNEVHAPHYCTELNCSLPGIGVGTYVLTVKSCCVCVKRRRRVCHLKSSNVRESSLIPPRRAPPATLHPVYRFLSTLL